MKEAKAIAVCDECGGDIYMDERYYCVDGAYICPDCSADFALRLLGPYRLGGEMTWPEP